MPDHKPDQEIKDSGNAFPPGHQKHEDRENPLKDHPTGHLGYNRQEHLADPHVQGADEKEKVKGEDRERNPFQR